MPTSTVRWAQSRGVSVFGRGDAISIAVIDEGIGIPKEALSRVFDKFYRVAGGDGEGARYGSGSLDLRGSGSRHGRQHPCGEPGQSRSRHADPRRTDGCEEIGNEFMTGQRILVVDDEPQILRFLRPSLTASGYDVLTAGTAAEAMKAGDRESPRCHIARSRPA